MMKQTYGSAPLYVLQPSALINFAAQTLELASQTLGYRDVAPCHSEDEVYPSKSSSRQKDEETGLEIYSLNEVIMHDTMGDCWIVLYDKVYDVTQFLLEHPGGEDVLLEHAGRDATIAFRGVGHSHAAIKSLESYQKGILPKEERIFTGEGSCHWETA